LKISSQIIAAAVLIATGATAVGLLANSHARRAMVKQVTAESQRTADMIASDLSTALNDFKTDVRSLSTTPAVAAAASAITPRDAAARRSLDAAYWNQPAARQSLLDTLQMNEAFPWMLAATRRFDPERTRPSKALLAGRDGVLIAAVGTPASLDHAAEPWFVQSMRRGTHFEPPAWDPTLAAQAMHYAVRVDDARGVPARAPLQTWNARCNPGDRKETPCRANSSPSRRSRGTSGCASESNGRRATKKERSA